MLRPLLLSALLAAPAAAQDEFDPWAFEEGSEARPWNLYAEHPARFEARVVDILCELSGDCPEDCGGGERQLGLLRAADGQLTFPTKNGQPAFTGAAVELQPFCGQDVEVDGLLLDDPDLGARNLYLVQRIRELDEEDWTTANRWTERWAENHPDAMGEGPWFRRDPRVNAAIEEQGYLGLGPEQEEAFLEELFAE
jgi:hypothetical protein